MSGRLIRAGTVPAQPWKNGLGVTRELAREPLPDGSGFLWRASIAEVDSAAPFSRFPGVDRTIVLLDGAGFRMTLDGTRQHALTTPLEPFAFPGEAEVSVVLAGGATRDFNLMVDRARARGHVRVCHGPAALPLDHTVVLLYLARGSATLAGHALVPGDSWLGPASTLTLAPGAAVLLVCVEPAAAPDTGATR